MSRDAPAGATGVSHVDPSRTRDGWVAGLCKPHAVFGQHPTSPRRVIFGAIKKVTVSRSPDGAMVPPRHEQRFPGRALSKTAAVEKQMVLHVLIYRQLAN